MNKGCLRIIAGTTAKQVIDHVGRVQQVRHGRGGSTGYPGSGGFARFPMGFLFTTHAPGGVKRVTASRIFQSVATSAAKVVVLTGGYYRRHIRSQPMSLFPAICNK